LRFRLVSSRDVCRRLRNNHFFLLLSRLTAPDPEKCQYCNPKPLYEALSNRSKRPASHESKTLFNYGNQWAY
jgi:hypothetical protein